MSDNELPDYLGCTESTEYRMSCGHLRAEWVQASEEAQQLAQFVPGPAYGYCGGCRREKERIYLPHKCPFCDEGRAHWHTLDEILEDRRWREAKARREALEGQQ